MRILVTGASGLLGLTVALEAAGTASAGSLPPGFAWNGPHDVVGTVHSRRLKTGAFPTVQADLRSPGAVERLLDETQPDWVINCAALALVDECETQPELAQQMNMELPGTLAKHVARGGARLLHLSTDSVFDGQRGEYTETDQASPINVYARTKLAGEQAVLEADPGAIVARVNLFGWSVTGKRSLAEWFFNNLSAGNPVKGFTDVYFCPLLANHLAHVLLQMLAAGLRGLYHVVSPVCTSKYAFGVDLARQFGLDERLIAPASLAGSGLAAARSPNLTLKSDKVQAALGLPLPTWQDGLPVFARLHGEGYSARLKDMSE